MLSAGNATGIYFALPTQLTSDKIYDRMNDFLGKVLADDCKFRSLLLHSSSWLRDTELGEEGMPGGGWFNSSKRGLLAPFAVGTIDQALMGVMNVKHGFVRAFGLAGKVVILDEVHSYDTYTGTIIQALVKTLSELHCTVIILSATLTSEKRAELLNKDSTENAYPLISAAPLGKPSFCLKVEKAVSSQVSLSLSPDDEVAVNEALHRAEQGEQVLWIENTVAESQQVYKLLSARAQACGKAIECGLLHSRFQRIHRSSNEEKWVGIYGKKGYSKRKECGRILVGTQVLEQSLDIDADFLVTRICPTDMLFQRIGRLWRHRKADKLRPISAKCEVLILSPRIDDCLKDVRIWGKTGRVYSPYVLYRSLDVWREITEIALPDSIRPMLQDTYVEKTEENGLINKTKSELIESREKLTGLARVTISSNGKTLPESKATTRYSKQESCEVLLIKNYLTDDTGTDVVFLNGSKIRLPKNIKTINTKEWRRLASELQKHIVLVPEYAAPVTLVNQIQWLKEYVYIGYLNESPFRAALVFLDGSLRGLDNGDALKGYSLSYTAETGYSCQKVENGAENNEW